MGVSIEDLLDLLRITLCALPDSGPLATAIKALQENPDMTDEQIREILEEKK